jgi:hypothetical protein
MKDIEVGLHAIQRFAERALGQPETTSAFDIPEKQREFIVNTIKAELPVVARELGEGKFNCPDLNIVLIVREFKVTTVKHLVNDYAPIKGGITRSGSKAKKKYRKGNIETLEYHKTKRKDHEKNKDRG